ncbi:hypothetical protein UFOVP331_39 [uncultured Caudovirales phage]|jgi:hypothetical protein|uniref:Uncharacterized protein n=1 Tax=uncultured Caudovirales phage TaxID=2100421 RepID=A0A6J5LX35_9CAUD|nr:hypothetical protein UFOVP331_39 [uncultured Caudovirales phage]
MIIVLTIITFVLALFLASVIIHIIKIQKELADLNEIYAEQDHLLTMMAKHNEILASAVLDIQKGLVEQQSVIYPFGRIMGEA